MPKSSAAEKTPKILPQNSATVLPPPVLTPQSSKAKRDKIEEILDEAGLRDEEIVIRMTGCPNGCARPALAEIAFIGKAVGKYNMYLGGGFHGQRLNKLYRENIGEAEILSELKPLLNRYAKERNEGEHFGDFCIRAGIVKEVQSGLDFHS